MDYLRHTKSLQASAGEFTTLSGASGLAYEDDVLFVVTHTGSIYSYDVSLSFPEQLRCSVGTWKSVAYVL